MPGGGGEGEETQILMIAVVNHLLEDHIFAIAEFLFVLSLEFCIFLQSVRCVGERDFHLHGAVAGLAAVCLVDDDGKVFPPALIHLLEDHGEFLQGAHDDADVRIDGVPEIFCGFLVVNQFHQSRLMFKAVDGGLQLGIKYAAVGIPGGMPRTSHYTHQSVFSTEFQFRCCVVLCSVRATASVRFSGIPKCRKHDFHIYQESSFHFM